jgi:hypothetical protein
MQRKKVSRLLIAALCVGVLQTSTSQQMALATGGPAGSVEFTYTPLSYSPNQYLSFSNIKLTGDFTIETWVKFKSTNHYASFLGQYGSTSTNRTFSPAIIADQICVGQVTTGIKISSPA